MSKTILRKPIITEKSMGLVSEGKYTFEVDITANKKEITTVITRLFSAEVEEVNTFVRAGKVKRIIRSRKTTQRPKRKFAVVHLKKGSKIDGFEKLLEVEDKNGN